MPKIFAIRATDISQFLPDDEIAFYDYPSFRSCAVGDLVQCRIGTKVASYNVISVELVNDPDYPPDLKLVTARLVKRE